MSHLLNEPYSQSFWWLVGGWCSTVFSITTGVRLFFTSSFTFILIQYTYCSTNVLSLRTYHRILTHPVYVFSFASPYILVLERFKSREYPGCEAMTYTCRYHWRFRRRYASQIHHFPRYAHSTSYSLRCRGYFQRNVRRR